MDRRKKAVVLKTQKEQIQKLELVKQNNTKIIVLKKNIDSAKLIIDSLSSELTKTQPLPDRLLASEYSSNKEYRRKKIDELNRAKQKLDLLNIDHAKAIAKHKESQKELAISTKLLAHLSKNP